MNQNEPASETVESMRIKNQLLQDLLEKREIQLATARKALLDTVVMLDMTSKEISRLADGTK
jgi:hypothetical protein